MATLTFRQAYKAERAARVPAPPRTPLLTRLARAAARRLPTWHGFRRAALSIAGLSTLTASAWHLHIAAGLAAAGLSLLVLEFLTDGDQ